MAAEVVLFAAAVESARRCQAVAVNRDISAAGRAWFGIVAIASVGVGLIALGFAASGLLG